jgi:hypothetical protein
MQGRPKGSKNCAADNAENDLGAAISRMVAKAKTIDPKRTARAVTFLTPAERVALGRIALARKCTVSDVLRDLVQVAARLPAGHADNG